MRKKTDKTSLLSQLSLFGSHQKRLLTEITNHLKEGKEVAFLATPNPEQIVQATQDRHLRQAFARARWLIPDGIGLVVASHFLAPLGKMAPVQQRLQGVDLVASLLTVAQEEQYRVCLVGGRDYQDLPQFQALGQKITFKWTPGYEEVTRPSPAEERNILLYLKDYRPQILFVAFGAPWQERWVSEHWEDLAEAGVKLVMVVGGSFDYIFEVVNRAPRGWRSLGLEWLYRLIKQPWRWRRQLRLLTFIQLVFLTAIWGPRRAHGG